MMPGAHPIVSLDADHVVSVAGEALVVCESESVAPPPTDELRELDGLAELILEWYGFDSGARPEEDDESNGMFDDELVLGRTFRLLLEPKVAFPA
jgi:hypothetical protein